MTKDTAETKEGVGQLIRAVLITHKNALTDGMPVAQLNNEYRELNAASIPFRELGYPSLMDLLISLQQSDDIVIGKRGSVQVVFPRINSKIAHVRALVANQKDSSRRHSRGGRKFTPRCNSKVAPPKPLKLGSQILADVLKLVRTKPNGIHVNKIVEYLADRNVHNIDNKSLKSQLFDVGHEVTIDYDMVYPVVKIHQTSQKTTSVLVPAGLSESDENEGWSSAKSSIGTNQENGMPEESQDVASPANENANVLSRDNENVPVATEDGIDMLVNKRTKFRLDKLIQQHPEGIWCADLPEYYKKEYRIPLNYEDLGFASVSDFAAHLPDIFHIVQLQEKGDFKLFNAKAPKPDTKETARQGRLSLAALHNVYQSYGDEDEPVPVTLSPATSQRLIPRGVMTYGETVPQIFVTELFPDNKDYVDVVVVDAITPTFFWIHLLKRTSKFRQFMAKLHEFYTENASKYVIPIVLLEKGLNCACIYDEKWHRAVIKTVKPDNSVTLMFYDYGTTMTYPPEAIHFLHRSFSALPAQAIPCGLYNVKPKYTEKWSYAECKKFVDKVLEVPLVAMLGTIDAENNSMLIGLTNTDGPTDIHINDWMVDTGYAIYGKMGDTVDMNESREDSSVITSVNGAGATSRDFGDISSTPLSLDPSAGRSSGLATCLDTIPEEATNLFDSTISPNVSALNAGQTSPQLLNIVIHQEKKILALESLIKAVIASGFNSGPPLVASALDDVNSWQSSAQQKFEPNGELKEAEGMLKDLTVNGETPRRDVSSGPQPIPPTPISVNFTEATSNRGNEYQSSMPSANGNDQYCINNGGASFEKRDLNGNVRHNRSQVNSAAPTLMTESYATPYCQNEVTPAASGHSQLSVPTKLSTPRETFEISVQQSARSFFDRLNATTKSNTRETNPFKVDFKSDDNHENKWTPEAAFLSSGRSAMNPFMNEGEDVQREEIPSNKVVYEAAPVMYDLWSSNRTQGEAVQRKEIPSNKAVYEAEPVMYDRWNSNRTQGEAVQREEIPSSKVVHKAAPYDLWSNNRTHERETIPAPHDQTAQEALEKLTQVNVASWVEQGRNTNANCVNKHKSVSEITSARPCDRGGSWDLPKHSVNSGLSGNTRTGNVPPPLPPRNYTSAVNLNIENEDSKVPRWIQAEEVAISFKSKSSPARSPGSHDEAFTDITGGGTVTVINEANPASKSEAVGNEVAAGREIEVPRSVTNYGAIKEIQLTKQKIYLIVLDNEGWLSLHELCSAFTNFANPDSIVKILNTIDAQIPFRRIRRNQYPTLFDKLEKSSLGVRRSHGNWIGNFIDLAPLKSIIKILRKLRIVDMSEVKLATKNGVFPTRSSALFDAYTIIRAHANFEDSPLT